MTGHHQIPSKIKSRLFSSFLKILPTIERSLIIEVEKKNFLSSLWPDDMDLDTIEVLQNSHLGGTDQKSCSF